MSQRKNFGCLKNEVLDIPDLIEIQTKSFADFLQKDTPPEERLNQGLQEAFKDIFPAQKEPDGKASLEFVKYEIGEPKKGLVECLKDGLTYQAALNVTFRLHTANGKDVKEESIYIGDIPLMTERGSFVINGAERVIVSQLHRSPGVSFERNRHASGKMLCSYKVIADHGSWLEVQFDQSDCIQIYLDRKRRRRKFLVSTFLRAFGYDGNEDILDAVYYLEEQPLTELKKLDDPSKVYIASDVKAAGKDSGLAVEGLAPCSEMVFDALQANGIKKVKVVHTDCLIEELNVDAPAAKAGAVKLVERNVKVTAEILSTLLDAMKEIEADREAVAAAEPNFNLDYEYGVSVRLLRPGKGGDYFIRCMQKDTVHTTEDAQKEIYKRMRPTDPPTAANARQLFKRLFEDPHRYNLGLVGRFKMNQALHLNWGRRQCVLTKQDIARSTAFLMYLHNGIGKEDDIDHLGRRRVRTVGELLQKQCQGLSAA